MKMKTTCTLALLLTAVFMCFAPFKSSAQETSQCIACHTSAKKLIDITREIAKSSPVAQETITAGEG